MSAANGCLVIAPSAPPGNTEALTSSQVKAALEIEDMKQGTSGSQTRT